MRRLDIPVGESFEGAGAHKLLRSRGFSQTLLRELKDGRSLLINDLPARTVDILHAGDTVSVIFPDETSFAVPNPGLKADIVYTDEDIAVFDKPPGMPVHQSFGHKDDTLANLFAALYPECAFRAVNRLDKDTSGLVVVAKNKLAAGWLMHDRRCRPQKHYYAVTDEGMCEKYGMSGEIIAPIAREREEEIKRVVREDGAYSHTKYRVIERGNGFCLSEITLLTGRTHQIRVHFAHIGFPLAGDSLYGGDMSCIQRQALHCGCMQLVHPVTGVELSLVSPLPEDIAGLLRQCLPDSELTQSYK